jgi:hypothetical protein
MSSGIISPSRKAFVAEVLKDPVLMKMHADIAAIHDTYLELKVWDGIANHTEHEQVRELALDSRLEAQKRLIKLLDDLVEPRLNNILDTSADAWKEEHNEK